MIATLAAHNVARSAVPTMAVGRVDPDAARIAIAVAGINCTELVLIARKVHIAFVATPGRGLSVSRSRIARKPSGVAALPRPSIFADMFITIAPLPHCRVVRWNGREESPHDRAKTARDPLDQAGALRQAH